MNFIFGLLLAALTSGASSIDPRESAKEVCFGRDNPNAPLYMVMVGGVCMLIAAAAVLLVKDVADHASGQAVIDADEHEPFGVQGSAQPVPSTGLNS